MEEHQAIVHLARVTNIFQVVNVYCVIQIVYLVKELQLIVLHAAQEKGGLLMFVIMPAQAHTILTNPIVSLAMKLALIVMEEHQAIVHLA